MVKGSSGATWLARALQLGLQLGSVGVGEDVGQTQAAGIGILRVHDDAAQEREAPGLELAGHRGGELGEHLAQDLEEVDRAEVIREEEGGGVGLLEDIGELVGLVARVQRHHHGAHQRAAVLGEEPGRTVGEPHRDLVVLPHAQREEGPREAPGLAPERGVGQPPIGGDEGLAVREARGHLGQHPARGRVEKWIGAHAVGGDTSMAPPRPPSLPLGSISISARPPSLPSAGTSARSPRLRLACRACYPPPVLTHASRADRS